LKIKSNKFININEVFFYSFSNIFLQNVREYAGSALTQANPIEADAYSYFCYENNEPGIIGIGYLGTICRTGNEKRYRTNINEYYQTDLESAEVLLLFFK